MLNEYLEIEKLQSDLKEFINAYHFLFTQIDSDRPIPIFNDKKLLAKLHHSLNLDKYRQSSFRKKLLLGAPSNQIIDFAKRIKINYGSYEETQTVEFRNKLATFHWGNNSDTRDFIEAFGYRDYLIPLENDDVFATRDIMCHDDPFKQLKDYQANVVFRALDIIKNPNSKFLIHMPTGAGKTRVAMEIISHFLNDNKTRQVIWLADCRELCEQAMDAFIRVWSHLGKHSIKTYRIWGKVPIPKCLESSAFAVAMYQKVRTSLDDNSKLKADFLVTDEAHIAITPTYSDTINKLKERRTRQTRIMGLTATPGRGFGMIEENEVLGSFFNFNIIGIDDEGGTIEHLQQKGVLARCQREVLNPEIEYTLTKEEWEKIGRNYELEFPDGLLETIANDQKRNLKIILRLLKMTDEYKRVIVFCGSVHQSKLLASFIDTCGYPAAYVDGTSPEAYRKDVVHKFQNGNIQFLFNYNVFTAGFDVPQIDAVVIARPTKSVVLYGQMIGRGMRGPQLGGTTVFTLVDVVDNILTEYGGLDTVYEYFTEYWK
ncbi:MAG: DEAD/DEAH box helicase family protein [Candidatus Nitrosoabyssus spongiisocia]|nr:MAG: DEAD/DEAH box helicase family protein [Nitrosopumilaceae archaeon AB1(1)]